MEGKNDENRSHRKIYYLFAFLFAWFGLAWWTFPKILEMIEIGATESGIMFFEKISFIFLPIFMGLSVLLMILSFYTDDEKGGI